MTPEQINIKIGEARGWRHMTDYGNLRQGWVDPKGALNDLPNFFGDLNAMHEAVNSLPLSERIEWMGWMDNLTEDPDDKLDQEWFPARFIRAKADKWAEAFLRTIGKWEGV